MALEAERAKATFDVSKLLYELYGESYAQKVKFEKLFSSNPLFDRRDDIYMGRDEYVKKLIQRSFETYKIVKANKDLLSAHSPLHGEGGFSVGSMGTPTGLTDHFALFILTLLNQATKEQQQEWLMKAINLQIIGTYAQTELGHGSNIRGLETTAVYDPDTDEFIINSPSITAAKWWPGALGLLATHAIVYARLIIRGKDYGFNAFVVQIRDEKHRPIAGVEAGDIGPKMGYNAYDSGYLLLKNIRIPRFNMLARFQSVEKGGEYKAAPPGLSKIAYLTMLRIRVGIAVGAGQALGKILTIAIRYNASRKQGFIDSKSPAAGENPILDYTVQQYKLFPQLATSYALIFASMNLRKMLVSFDQQLAKGGDASTLPVLHATSAGLKAFSTELAVDGIDEARKCCGGHAYSLSAGIGMFQMYYLPSITFEGDYVPMALQTARFLVNTVGAIAKGSKIPGPASYLAAKPSGKVPSTVEECFEVDTLVTVFQDASRRSAFAAAGRIQSHLKQKRPFDEAWNAEHVVLMKAARNHTMTFILTQFAEAAKAVADEKVRVVQLQLVRLFALIRFHEFGRFAQITPSFGALIDEAVARLLAQVRPNAVSLVDGLGNSDFQLATSIGNYNNSDMYERLVDTARRNPLNAPGFHEAFYSETISKFLDKQYIAKSKALQSHI